MLIDQEKICTSHNPITHITEEKILKKLKITVFAWTENISSQNKTIYLISSAKLKD